MILLKIKLNSNKYFKTYLYAFATCLLSLNYILYQVFDLVEVKTPMRVLVFSLFLLIAFINFKHYRFGIKEIIILSLLLITTVISSDVSNFLFLVFIAFSFREISYFKFIKIISIFNIILASLLIVGLISGKLENRMFYSPMRVRYTLGFIGTNANAAAQFYFSVIVLYILSARRINVINLFIIIFLLLILFYFTDTRSLIFVTIIGCGIYLMVKNINSNISILLTMLLGLLFFHAFFISFLNQLLPQLNVYSSGRILKYFNLISTWNLFNLLFGGVPNQLESFYLSFVSYHGLLILISIFFLTKRTIILFYRNGLYLEVSVIYALLSYGVVESSLMRPEIVAFMVYWIYIANPRQIIREIKKEKVRRIKCDNVYPKFSV